MTEFVENMKFTCLQENLAKSLGLVSKAVPTKSSLPILSNTLISAQSGRLKIAATNLDVFIVTYVGANIEEEGGITVPAKLIRDFVSHLSPDTLTANLKEDILHLKSRGSKAKFNGISHADFPEVPAFPKGDFLEVDPGVFREAVSAVVFAAATDDSRPIFTGVLVNYEKGELILAASDGFRLSEKKVSAGGKADKFSTIIPAKVLLEVSRVFATSSEPIKMAFVEKSNTMFFESEDTIVVARVLEGSFPDYKRIIPKDFTVTAEFLVSDLLEAVRLASLFASDVGSTIKLSFDPKGFVNLSSTTQEIGAHNSKLDVEVEGDSLEMIFNSKYILDFLNNVKTERITFGSGGATAPCLVRPVDEENFLHVIMPIQHR